MASIDEYTFVRKGGDGMSKNGKSVSNKHCVIGRKHLIKVTCYAHAFCSGGMHDYKYTISFKIGFGTSMREIALRTIELAHEERPECFEKMSSDCPIGIFLKGRSEKERLASPYGIGYDLNNDGSVIFLDGYKPLNHDWTYERIRALNNLGYISGDVDHIIVEIPCGLGGPGEMNFDALLESALVFIGIISNIEGVLQLMDRLVSRASYHRMVKDFKKNGLYSLKQIRNLLETNKTWKLKKVMKAFSVNRNVALRILRKLGYTSKNGVWCFDNESVESLEMRKQWLAKEKLEERMINELIMKSFE